MKKRFIIPILIAIVLGLSMQAHAALQNLGTDSLGNRIIYDIDLNLMWYDYSNSGNWQSMMNWADELSVEFGGTTIDDWRLPTALNQDGSDPCFGYNCTGSELGHLYYTELGNAVGGPLSNTGYFQNLQSFDYWSGTEYSADPTTAWGFNTRDGFQLNYVNGHNGVYAMAVRVVPEPISSILFVTGGTLLAGRRFIKRKKKA